MSVLLHGCTTWTLNESVEKKVRREQHKNATGCFEQNLEEVPHKTAAVHSHTALSFKPSK